MNFKRTALLAALLCLGASPAPAGEKVTAVLSSGAGAYMEAFSAFQAAYGAKVDYIDLSRTDRRAIPAGTGIIVAFGAKAAGRSYPKGTDLVYCLAPGLLIDQQNRQGRTIKISMLASPRLLFDTLKSLQPSLKRLAYFWTAPGYSGDFENDLRGAGEAAGVEIVPVRVADPGRLPGALRANLDKMDAFLLPPDPLLFSTENLMIFKRFSLDNGVPMYAGTRALALEGAVATVGVSFTDSGRLAAEAVKAIERGESSPSRLYATHMELTLNASSAKRCAIELTPEILKSAAQVYP